jgi:hypothetical protein
MATQILTFQGGATGAVYDTNYYFEVPGSYAYIGNYNGQSKIYTSKGGAITGVLQGILRTINTDLVQNPPWFGGLTPDNTANGYTYPIDGEYAVSTVVPNSNAPVCTHIWDERNQFIWRVAKVEDDNYLWIEDPYNLASAFSGNMQGTSVHLSGMTKVTITNDAAYNLVLVNQQPVNISSSTTITLLPNNEGVVEPFLISGNDGNITVTITQ